MAFVPNLQPPYSLGPIAAGPVVLPAAAKSTLSDNANAILILPSMANNRQVIQNLYAEVTATLAAGKLLAFLYNGTTAFQVADVTHAALTVSATAGVSPISFPFSTAAPLIVPEGFSLYLATAVGQSAGALVGYGTGKLY